MIVNLCVGLYFPLVIVCVYCVYGRWCGCFFVCVGGCEMICIISSAHVV